MTYPPGRLVELARLFSRLGVVAFGGPAAHIAMMEDEVVTRRGWLDRQHFLDLVGATNLVPGPNSTEMSMHVGYERAGWRGLLVAGTCFILPAAMLTGALAWFYVRFGTVPAVQPFLVGIKPAVLAVIVGAVWRLGRKAVKGWRLAVLGGMVAAAVMLGVNELVALLGGGVAGMLWLRLGSGGSLRLGLFALLLQGKSRAAWAATAGAAALVVPLQEVTETTSAVPLDGLFLFFLKVGAVLYGSGYVLVAFLRGDLVHDYGWLTEAQLLDAVAIGQFTPGPVLTTSTFIGAVLAGVPGALVATVGIFLPSFLFVRLLNPLVRGLRTSPWASAFLDAVNMSAVALMAAVTVELAGGALTSWPAWLIASVSAALVVVLRVNSAWLVLGGAVLGWLLSPWMG